MSNLSVQGSRDEPGVVHGHAQASDGLVVGVELGQELSGYQVPDPDVVDPCRGQEAAVGEEHHRFHRAAHIKVENQTRYMRYGVYKSRAPVTIPVLDLKGFLGHSLGLFLFWA